MALEASGNSPFGGGTIGMVVCDGGGNTGGLGRVVGVVICDGGGTGGFGRLAGTVICNGGGADCDNTAGVARVVSSSSSSSLSDVMSFSTKC